MPLAPKAKIRDTVLVSEFFENAKDKLDLSLVTGEAGLNRKIREKSVNRPSLALTGFFKYFAFRRVQLFGAGEMGYLRNLSEEEQRAILRELMHRQIPCIVISRNLAPTPSLLKACEEHKIPLLRSTLTSRDCQTTATLLLEEFFAPRITEHGTMMDVKGIGVLLRGGSGVGKSECALALIERGYALVADDFVQIMLMNERELVAKAKGLNRGYMECRGLGIINIEYLFGVRALRLEKRIDLVVTFTDWQPGCDEERTGMEERYYDILGVRLPHVELPVRPGRDMARLVEVASMITALRQLGHNPAEEFNERLIEEMATKPGGDS